MGDGHFGGEEDHRVKWSVCFGGVGREDGLDVFGFGEDVFVIAVWFICLFMLLCYSVWGG